MSTIPDVSLLTPEEVVQHLQALYTRIPDFVLMAAGEAQSLSGAARVTDVFLHAAINAIAVTPKLRDALGRDAELLRQEVELAARWSQVVDEVVKLRLGVTGAIRTRRHRVGGTALRVYQISRQLVRYDENPGLLPHIDAMRRASQFNKRRVATPKPDTPPVTPPREEEPKPKK